MDDGPSTRWEAVQETLAGKWTLPLLRELSQGTRRYGDLETALDEVSSKTLSRRLRELRCHGLVERTVQPTSPPTTRYELTPAGERFTDVVGDLVGMTEVVDCAGCEETCQLPSVDPNRTVRALEECC